MRYGKLCNKYLIHYYSRTPGPTYKQPYMVDIWCTPAYTYSAKQGASTSIPIYYTVRPVFVQLFSSNPVRLGLNEMYWTKTGGRKQVGRKVGLLSELNCEIYQRGRVCRVADTELVLPITHLIRPTGSIPGVG